MRPAIRLALVIAGVLLAHHVLAQEPTPWYKDLAQLELSRIEWDSEKKLARKLYPLGEEWVRQAFSKALGGKVLPRYIQGMKVVVYAHGARGFLWAISLLSTSDSLDLLRHLCDVLRYHRYRETYVFYRCLMDDKRAFPPPSEEFIKSLVTVMDGRMTTGVYHGPYRVCDEGFHSLCLMPGIEGDLPQVFRGKSRLMCVETPIEERDRWIEMFKEWWDKEGERLVSPKHPSVIEAILKESEEKAKKEAGGKAKSESPPRLKEPAKGEGEKAEPKQK